MFLTLDEIAFATRGEILSGDPSAFAGGAAPGGVAIDSRRILPGQWFVALPGKKGRDGHDFLESAIASGTGGLIVSNRDAWENAAANRPEIPALLVVDTILALADMARALLDKFSPYVIAITGTVGKTSVKEAVAHIVSSRWMSLKSPHNWNTEIGIPLTIFDLTGEHRVAILECASRGIGQIHYLSEIARPDVAAITAIGPGHLSEFGTIERVARAKWEILDGLKSDGIGVAPGDSPYTNIYRSNYPIATFGIGESNDFHPSTFKYGEFNMAATISTPDGEFETSIPGSGLAELTNALCATAICRQIKIAGSHGIETLSLEQIDKGLRTLPAIEGRSETMLRPSGVEVIFDAYNSNPMSLGNALDSFARRVYLTNGSPVKRHIAILGDMLELGVEEEKYHREAGKHVGRLPIDVLLTVGRLSELIRESAEETRGIKISGEHKLSTEELTGELSKWVRPGDLVLIKGSHAIALEGLLKGDW